MVIGVDAGCIGINDSRLKVGVYQVAINLLENIGKLDKQNEYLLYSFNPIPKELLNKFGPRMKNILIKPTLGWAKIWLPLQILRQKPDVFLGLNQFLPSFHPEKSVVMVYDLSFEFYPECYIDSMPRISKITKNAVKNSSKIIAISESTRNNLIEIYHSSEEKIKVSYLGCDNIFEPKPVLQIERIRNKYQIKNRYFLFVGSLKKIKNIPTILKGFAKFLKTKKDVNFIFVGGDFWMDKEINDMLNKLSLKEKVIFTGYVPRSDLPVLYSGALAFVSPSLYEGFGIPAIEAMACGCPVIASNIPVMREIVNGNGILVNPKSPTDIYLALEKIVDGKRLRFNFSKKGISYSKRFSWQKFSQNVLEELI